MRSVTVRVPAKINLSLGVGPVSPDGYHRLATVYQAIDVYDEVRATEVGDDSMSVSVQFDDPDEALSSDVPEDGDNLALQAAWLLREHAEVDEGVALSIRKVIPVAGGMAGGSADAAAALVACNALWELHYSRDKLEELASVLGSDVPFCVRGGIAMGTGRGEQLSPVLARGHYHWVLAFADQGLSTAEVYAEFDRLHQGAPPPEPQVDPEMLAALRAGDAEALGATLSNDLSAAALSLRPELAATLEVGEACGVLGSLISGSGPTVLFLVRDEEHAMDVAVALSSARVCSDVVQALGPVHGARLTTT